MAVPSRARQGRRNGWLWRRYRTSKFLGIICWLSVKDSKRPGRRALSGLGFEHDTVWARYKGFGEKSALQALFGVSRPRRLILRCKNLGKTGGFQGSSCPRSTNGQIGWRRERNCKQTCSKQPAQVLSGGTETSKNLLFGHSIRCSPRGERTLLQERAWTLLV